MPPKHLKTFNSDRGYIVSLKNGGCECSYLDVLHFSRCKTFRTLKEAQIFMEELGYFAI